MNAPAAFQVGRILMSQPVIDWAAKYLSIAEFVQYCLERHQQGDWGDCCPEDKARNDQALQRGKLLFSVYLIPHGLQILNRNQKLWIMTAPDRSTTSVLFRSEYQNHLLKKNYHD